MLKNWLCAAFVAALLLGCAAQSTPETRPRAFVTVTPTRPPTLTPLPPTPSPPPPDDFSAYRQTMRPAFADDVSRLADTGITRYQINLQYTPPNLAQSTPARLDGKMNVEFTNTETVLLNQTYFRLFPNTPSYGGKMTVDHVEVDGAPAQTKLLAQETTLEVTLPQTLSPGESVTISMDYAVEIPFGTESGYGLFGWNNSVTALAGFFPIIPVFDNLGWHIEILPLFGDSTYTDVALFDVSLTLPMDKTVITTGDIIAETDHDNGQKTIRAVAAPVRGFFIAQGTDISQLSGESNGIAVTSYFPAGYESQGQNMLQWASDALRIYSQFFGEYPYKSFDVVAVPMPDVLGGVEFPGVIAMALRYYQFPQNVTEFVTAHEVAHQWWYGLVGNDQANEPWLDEAITQYSAVIYFEQMYGADERQTLVDLYFNYPYNQLVAMGDNRPVAGAVSDFSEFEYNNVVYGKGPLFFDALRTHLGDPLFYAGLRSYADANRYGIVKPANLLDAFEQTSGQDMTWLYNQWILGE